MSKSGLCFTMSPGLVAMSTPPPLPLSVGLSLRMTVMLKGAGKISEELMSAVNHVSVPIIMSGL